MQRRPLSPLPVDAKAFRSPFDCIMHFFNIATVSSHNILCAAPLIYAQNYAELFHLIGFVDCPLNPKGKKQVLYPARPPQGQHPTGFLQYGAKIQSHSRNQSHAFFEIGDHHNLIRLDFKESFREGEDVPIYQLDELVISDGAVDYALDCEDKTHLRFIEMTMEITKSAVCHMHREDFEGAKQCFMQLKTLVEILNDLSNGMMAKHLAEQIAAKPDAGDYGKKTP